MKNETTSAAVENTDSKLAWSTPTLTTLSLPLETHANAAMGGDGGMTGGATLT